MATTLVKSEKESRIFIYDQIPTIWWKLDENRFSRSWEDWSL